ncbi:MAG TPA: transaldolase [Thermoleophilia bacterium]|nr:transaldolase [Acidobacteriota bacterium]HQF53092.1 transaldolase [Thermoleophilia bacterium]
MPPAESRLAGLRRLGQSPWLDHIDKALIQRGGLKRMIERDGLGGVTTNPSIFEKSIGGGEEYDAAVLELAREGLRSAEILDRLIIDDVRAACDVFAPVYLASGGEDGFVSIEVAPGFARDTQGSIAEAHRLFAAVDRPNVLVKIPGTREGVPAILQCLKDGLNINITLLFTLSQYEAVAEAYLQALDYRLHAGETIRASASVASLFVSRVDTMVDKLLDEKAGAAADEAERRRLLSLRGRAGVANARVVYERFRGFLNGREWQLIAASGAKVQRVLWASTGVKNPAYPDTLYVDELIGAQTVSTMPEHTLQAFREHGTVAQTADRHIDDAHRLLRELNHVGIDVERVGAQLQDDGIALFVKAFDDAVAIVEEKRARLLSAEGAE